MSSVLSFMLLVTAGRTGQPHGFENRITDAKTSLSYTGEWTLFVKGKPTVGTGYGDFSETFSFRDGRTGNRFQSILLARVSPVTETTKLFYQDWDATVQSLTGYVQKFEERGTAVVSVGHDRIHNEDGGVYEFSFELHNGDYSIPITMAWRFHQSYYVSLLGVNWGDMPEISHITTEAAKDFQDHTEEPLTGWEQVTINRRFEPDVPEWIYHWDYSIINPFLAIGMYLYDEGGFYHPTEPEAPVTQDAPYNWGDQTAKPAEEVIPSMETFLERYNEAATELGTPIIIQENLKELKRGSDKVEGGFQYDIRNHRGNLVAVIRFSPHYVWLILPSEGERERLLVYAATAAAVTGLPAKDRLAAMTDLVLHAEIDIERLKFNGYEVYVNSAVLNGVPFKYENGRFPDAANKIYHGQMHVNPDGRQLNNQ